MAKVCFFQFEAIPKHDNPESVDVGGALINCWVSAPTLREGELLARSHVDASGWLIGSREDAAVIERSDCIGDPDALAFYSEAEAQGAVYIFHTWPLGSDDDDTSDEDGADLPA
jgi:hypothetical protein